jgi:RND family efflux transporter MFP subunit
MALFALGLWACGEGASSSRDVAASAPPVLETTEVVQENLAEPILGTGTIAPQKTTNVGPRVDGIIAEVLVNVGDRVEAGAPLFRTREVDYRIRLQAAEAELQLARAEATKAASDLERAGALRSKRVVSAEQLEGAQTRRKIAVARVEAVEAALDRARQDLEDTVVTAPYAGTITKRLVDEGAMMRTMMSAGNPVVQIMKTDIVLAIVFVPEIHLPYIGVGTPARVHIDGLNREVESEVYILNDLVDPATHTVEVRLPILNKDLAVKPGLFVKAELQPNARVAKVLDRTAVLGFGEERYVFVEKESRAIRKRVRVRDLDASRVEVLEGLESGQRVLVGPELAGLTDGASVQIAPSTAEASSVDL